MCGSCAFARYLDNDESADKQDSEQPVGHMTHSSGTAIVVLAFLAFIAIGFIAGVSGVAWPSMRDTFGVSQDAIGALLMLSTVGALAMNVSTGRLINDIGLGILLLIGCLISGFGYLGYALAPTWWILVAFGFVTAIGSTGLIAGLNTFFAINQTPRLMIWLQACFGLGAIVSPSVVTALLSNHYSWRWAYGLVVLLMVGLALGFFLTVKSWRMAQPEVGNSPPHLDTAAADPADSSDDWENGPVRKTGSTAALRMPAVWLSLLLFFVSEGRQQRYRQNILSPHIRSDRL